MQMDASRGRSRRAIVRGIVVALVAVMALGALQMPASAGPAFHKDLQVAPRSYKGLSYRLDAHFTASYRNKGWIQTYGVVKVTNKSKRTIDVMCDITLKTGGVAVGFGSVDLRVAKNRSLIVPFGIEAGDESGVVTGGYVCTTSA